jgi:hypothetical protein
VRGQPPGTSFFESESGAAVPPHFTFDLELKTSHQPFSQPITASKVKFSKMLPHITMSNPEIIATVSIIVNCRLGVFLYRGNGRRNEYDFVDNQIADILKIQMQYPEYRREGFSPTEEIDRLRFDAYRCLVWNSLETMYEKYGERRLKKSSFFPAMRLLARRHKAWLTDDGSGYALKLKRFLTE